MATFIFQRASWSLQISRTSRVFSVSLTTALPRRGKPRVLPRDISNPRPSTSTSHQSSRHQTSDTLHRRSETRRAFSQTRFARAAQAEEPSRATKQATSQSSPPQNPVSQVADLSSGLNDHNLQEENGSQQSDWTRSFHGLSLEPFPPETAKALLAPVDPSDIEIKPDGIIYLPEIKYRRILNQAFGPGGWGLAPRGETIVTAKAVTREYALVALGR